MKHFKHLAILVVVVALSANANPSLLRSYGLPQSGNHQSGSSQLSHGHISPGGGGGTIVSNPIGGPTSHGSGISGTIGTSFGRPCNGEEVRNALGECVLPQVSRNIFVYAAPKVITGSRPRPNIPKPEVHYNFVFVKTADLAKQNDPIVVPPPQQKTLVYVLSKKQQQGGGGVIQTPYTPAPRPEVFYVNYGQGDNPQLPGGINLQTALNSAYTQGQNLNFQGSSSGSGQNLNFQGSSSGSGQNLNFQSSSSFGSGANQGSGNFVGNVIDGGTISGGIVGPSLSSPPIHGGIIDGGIVSGGTIDQGFNAGISLAQAQVDSGFGQGGHIQPSQFGQNVALSPTISSGGSSGVQAPSTSLGYPSQTPSPIFNPTGSPSPPSRPGTGYITPN